MSHLKYKALIKSVFSVSHDPPRALSDHHPQHTHQLFLLTSFLHFAFHSFLLDEVQALPGGPHLSDFNILGLVALHSFFSLSLSPSFSACRCRCGPAWALKSRVCFPAGLFFSSSFLSACTRAREQLCLFLLPTSSAQQPVISVWSHRYQRRRAEGKKSSVCRTVVLVRICQCETNFSNRERFFVSQGKLWSLCSTVYDDLLS